MKSLSCVRLFATPWTVAYKALRSMGFSRQEYRSGLPFPSPGDLPNPGIEPRSPALQTDALPSAATWRPKENPNKIWHSFHFWNISLAAIRRMNFTETLCLKGIKLGDYCNIPGERLCRLKLGFWLCVCVCVYIYIYIYMSRVIPESEMNYSRVRDKNTLLCIR